MSDQDDFTRSVIRANANIEWSLHILEALLTNLTKEQTSYYQKKADDLASALAEDAGIEVCTPDQKARLLALFMS